MTLTVRPQLEQFIKDQVETGRFGSAEEVVEAGLARLMLDPALDVLDEQDQIDIQKSLEQMDRGELIDSSIVHAEMRRKYLNESK